jgi:hypothetical protein
VKLSRSWLGRTPGTGITKGLKRGRSAVGVAVTAAVGVAGVALDFDLA